MLRQSCLPNGGKDRLHHKYDRSYIHEKYSDLWHNLLHNWYWGIWSCEGWECRRPVGHPTHWYVKHCWDRPLPSTLYGQWHRELSRSSENPSLGKSLSPLHSSADRRYRRFSVRYAHPYTGHRYPVARQIYRISHGVLLHSSNLLYRDHSPGEWYVLVYCPH